VTRPSRKLEQQDKNSTLIYAFGEKTELLLWNAYLTVAVIVVRLMWASLRYIDVSQLQRPFVILRLAGS